MEHLLNRLIRLAAEKPDKQAVIFKKEKLTYRGLYLKISGMAALLKQHGVTHGDRVCFAAVSMPQMVAAYMAVQSCGAAAVFLDKNSAPLQMADICKRAGARLLLTDKPLGGQKICCPVLSLRQLYEQADLQGNEAACTKIDPAADDIAEILFTTGTTGMPKGVILTYVSVYHILSNTIKGIGIREDDCLLLPLPLHHSFALRVLRAVLYQGGTVVLQNGFTFAKEAEKNVEAFGCNALAAVPASFEVMKSQMQEAFARVLGKMRYIEFSAGSLSIRQRREITALLQDVQIYNTWGSSETGGAIFCNVSEAVHDKTKAGTLGKTLPGVRARVVDTEGNEIESDASHPGRLALKGDMLMAGYWSQPELTKQMLKDGWLITGDMVYQDADGFLFMLGRADDIINTGGEKVSPIEVEEMAGQYEWIRECACIGTDDPDGVLGQVPVLFVSVKSGYQEDGLLKFLSENMERYKIPKKIVSIQEIPRNHMYKPDRQKLLWMWENREAMDFMNPVMQALLARRSIRSYTDQKIPRQILDMILKAGYHAPSGHNMQSWRFTVLTRQSDLLLLKEKAEEAARKNSVYFYGWGNPSAMVLVSNDKRNPDGCQDASCAAQNIMLAAYSYGIGSVWLNPFMTLRSAEPVKSVLDAFGIPENHIVWAAVALGYPVSEGAALKKKEDVVRYV